MLAVQKFLLEQGGTLEQLSNDLGIRVNRHPDENVPLLNLNYHIIDSPKLNEIVRNCRSLTLNSNNFSLVARAFDRFYNVNEAIHLMDSFDWSSCWASNKEDGSLIKLFYFQDSWRITTKTTFGEGQLAFDGTTWSKIFFDIITPELIDAACEQEKCYVFELWTPHNKIVTDYKTPCAFLLTVYDGECELDQSVSDDVAKELKCRRPKKYNFSSLDEVQKFVKEKGIEDPTWEGIVLCDGKFNRWKCKNSLYLNLAHIKDNGNIYNPKNLLPLVMNGEIEELVGYMPEIGDAAKEMKLEVDRAYAHLVELWQETKDIASQKEFAQTIVPRTKFSSLLFKARQTGKPIADLWAGAEDLILKVLYTQQLTS